MFFFLDQIICGCTHLTAFSALFVPGAAGECGVGAWEWGVLQTVAASLLTFCLVMMVLLLIGEHQLIYKKRKAAIKSKTKRGRKVVQ